MKYYRPLSKIVKKRNIHYNSRHFLPVPAKIKSVTILADNLPANGSYPFTLSDKGEVIHEGIITNGLPIKFTPPIKVAFGKHEFCFHVAMLPDIEHVTGSIEIEYSLSIF